MQQEEAEQEIARPQSVVGRLYLALAALFGGLAVLAGAFATHSLKTYFMASGSVRSLEIFETAARYQMYHALALLAVAVLLVQERGAATFWLRLSGACLIAGTVVFSGSLYSLSLTGVAWLGAVTPLGGLGLLGGWGCLAIASLRLD